MIQVKPEIGDPLSDVVAKMLAKSPEARYQGMHL